MTTRVRANMKKMLEIPGCSGHGDPVCLFLTHNYPHAPPRPGVLLEPTMPAVFARAWARFLAIAPPSRPCKLDRRPPRAPPMRGMREVDLDKPWLLSFLCILRFAMASISRRYVAMANSFILARGMGVSSADTLK